MINYPIVTTPKYQWLRTTELYSHIQLLLVSGLCSESPYSGTRTHRTITSLNSISHCGKGKRGLEDSSSQIKCSTLASKWLTVQAMTSYSPIQLQGGCRENAILPWGHQGEANWNVCWRMNDFHIQFPNEVILASCKIRSLCGAEDGREGTTFKWNWIYIHTIFREF